MEIQSNAVKPVGSIEEGWNIIKDDYWIFFLMSLVFIVIVIAVGFLVGLIQNGISAGITMAIGAVKPEGNAATVAMVVPQLISLTIGIFTNILVATLTGILMCGFMKALSRKVQTGVVDFGDLFSGFDKFQPCLIYSVILSLIQYVIGIGAIVIGVVFGVTLSAESFLKDGKFNPAIFKDLIGIFILIIIAAIIINLIITICMAFVYPLIAERNMSGLEAISNSVRGGLSNILPLIGFFILQILMAFGGALLCLVGVLFVAPLLYASTFAAYRQVFGGPEGSFMNHQPPPPPIFNNQPSY
jgi:uncharacterized membrane protein